MELFFADIDKGTSKSWDDLLADLWQIDEYSLFCRESDFYLIFKQIIVSLILEREIVLLDSDLSDEEAFRLIGNVDFTFKEKVDRSLFVSITSKDILIERLKQVGSMWCVTLFTSGTTGLPKKVSHTYETINRFVKVTVKHKLNIWGYAYNPTHIAGVQVFFQAILNGNAIIRLFGLSKESVFQSISEYSISNISATPTFFRLLVPTHNQFPSVTRLTSGGERFDEKTSVMLNQVFPNAKMINVYASTEAGTLLATIGNEFFVKEEFINLIKVEKNELVIHRSLLGKSEMLDNQWYFTGDLVEIVTRNPLRFRFLARNNEMINVGGYKVNPSEVEDAIRSIAGVTDVRVFAKSNSLLGNVIICEVIRGNSSIDEIFLRKQLKTQLQEFKIPRMIRFVDSLSTTRSGKIKRD